MGWTEPPQVVFVFIIAFRGMDSNQLVPENFGAIGFRTLETEPEMVLCIRTPSLRLRGCREHATSRRALVFHGRHLSIGHHTLAASSEEQTGPFKGIPWQGDLRIQIAPIPCRLLCLDRLWFLTPEMRHHSLRLCPPDLDPIAPTINRCNLVEVPGGGARTWSSRLAASRLSSFSADTSLDREVHVSPLLHRNSLQRMQFSSPYRAG